ncbi:MAG: hypothetical protein KDC26_01800 [Armatimonadetes bacterium]|nr:hypothetical protein [Armatimonadota bacterium]
MRHNDAETDLKEAFRREIIADADAQPSIEVEFEKARGINHIEIRSGFSGVHVLNLSEPLMASRLGVLDAIKNAKISIDFVKITRDGLSFIIPGAEHDNAKFTLDKLNINAEVRPNEAVLTVHAVNMRDEEGLVARIVSEVIASGAKIDHLGDMHDRLLMVMNFDDAKRAEAALRDGIMKESAE